MIKIASIGIVTVILAVFCKGIKNEYGIYLAIAGCVMLLYLAVNRLSGIVDIISSFKGYLTIDNLYIVILLKMLGIAFVAEVSAAICRDAGYTSVSSLVELIGKLSILLTSAPILEALLDTVFATL